MDFEFGIFGWVFVMLFDVFLESQSSLRLCQILFVFLQKKAKKNDNEKEGQKANKKGKASKKGNKKANTKVNKKGNKKSRRKRNGDPMEIL